MAAVQEFDLIARIQSRIGMRDDVLIGIGDDAAVLQVPAGQALVVATDTLNSGVHFPVETAPADIGWKALAVNLSDLAAMGAEPAWCSLSLSLPSADTQWLDTFLDGFLALAMRHDVALVGGDTTRGPLSICVTVHGFIEPARVLRRDAAQVDDDIWVTGTLGDAAGALSQWQSGVSPDPSLRARLDRPLPRIAVGQALVDIARAAIDVSDGLLADLGHVCKASSVGAEVEIDALPASPALVATFGQATRRAFQATGGDDYELCFTAARVARSQIETIAGGLGLAVTRIGSIHAGDAVRARCADGSDWSVTHKGHVHFS